MPKKSKSKTPTLKYSVLIVDKDLNDIEFKFNEKSELHGLLASVSWNTYAVLPDLGTVKRFIAEPQTVQYAIREWQSVRETLLQELESDPTRYCELKHKLWLVNRLIFTLKEVWNTQSIVEDKKVV